MRYKTKCNYFFHKNSPQNDLIYCIVVRIDARLIICSIITHFISLTPFVTFPHLVMMHLSTISLYNIYHSVKRFRSVTDTGEC